MSEEFVRYLALFFLLIAFYFWGYYRGKKSRKFTLQGMLPKQIFAYFLKHEIERHLRDVSRSEADLRYLMKTGTQVPDLPTGLWFEVK